MAFSACKVFAGLKDFKSRKPTEPKGPKVFAVSRSRKKKFPQRLRPHPGKIFGGPDTGVDPRENVPSSRLRFACKALSAGRFGADEAMPWQLQLGTPSALPIAWGALAVARGALFMIARQVATLSLKPGTSLNKETFPLVHLSGLVGNSRCQVERQALEAMRADSWEAMFRFLFARVYRFSSGFQLGFVTGALETTAPRPSREACKQQPRPSRPGIRQGPSPAFMALMALMALICLGPRPSFREQLLEQAWSRQRCLSAHFCSPGATAVDRSRVSSAQGRFN